MRSSGDSRPPHFVVYVAALLAALIVGRCGNCLDKIVGRQLVEGSEIAIHHRVCGSVAGYMVSVAPPNTSMKSHADEFEPFMMVCDCYRSEATPPVNVRVERSRRLVVSYDSTRAWRVEKMRARQGAFTIEYKTYKGQEKKSTAASR